MFKYSQQQIGQELKFENKTMQLCQMRVECIKSKNIKPQLSHTNLQCQQT